MSEEAAPLIMVQVPEPLPDENVMVHVEGVRYPDGAGNLVPFVRMRHASPRGGVHWTFIPAAQAENFAEAIVAAALEVRSSLVIAQAVPDISPGGRG